MKKQILNILRLKELGVYEIWRNAVKRRWERLEQDDIKRIINEHLKRETLYELIDCSLEWSRTLEGHEFWRTIACSDTWVI